MKGFWLLRPVVASYGTFQNPMDCQPVFPLVDVCAAVQMILGPLNADVVVMVAPRVRVFPLPATDVLETVQERLINTCVAERFRLLLASCQVATNI